MGDLYHALLNTPPVDPLLMTYVIRESRNVEPSDSMGMAIYNERESHRYVLARVWDSGSVVNFTMLNPSTATERVLDPTLRRCMAYARAWGYAGFIVTNIFAYRATDPTVMKCAFDPVGADNNAWLLRVMRASKLNVAGWGAHGGHNRRDEWVQQLYKDAGVPLYYLRMTQGGYPGHPLYLPSNLRPVLWEY